MSTAKCGAAAHMIVPARKATMARAKRALVRKRRLRKEEIGMIAARTRR